MNPRLTDSGAIADDRQVCALDARGFYGAVGESPCVLVLWDAVAL